MAVCGPSGTEEVGPVVTHVPTRTDGSLLLPLPSSSGLGQDTGRTRTTLEHWRVGAGPLLHPRGVEWSPRALYAPIFYQEKFQTYRKAETNTVDTDTFTET